MQRFRQEVEFMQTQESSAKDFEERYIEHEIERRLLALAEKKKKQEQEQVKYPGLLHLRSAIKKYSNPHHVLHKTIKHGHEHNMSFQHNDTRASRRDSAVAVDECLGHEKKEEEGGEGKEADQAAPGPEPRPRRSTRVRRPTAKLSEAMAQKRRRM